MPGGGGGSVPWKGNTLPPGMAELGGRGVGGTATVPGPGGGAIPWANAPWHPREVAMAATTRRGRRFVMMDLDSRERMVWGTGATCFLPRGPRPKSLSRAKSPIGRATFLLNRQIRENSLKNFAGRFTPRRGGQTHFFLDL